MSKIFSAALLASCAAAQLTTSIWMPGADSGGVSLKASVVKVDKDRTTMSMALPTESGSSELADIAQTITVAGNTYYGFDANAADMGASVYIVGQCTRKDTSEKVATCTISTKGLDAAISSFCGGDDADPDVCSGGSALETSMTTTLPEGYVGMFPIVITAGENLLPSASAGGSPSATGASATASSTPSGSQAVKSDKPTASGSKDASPTSKSTDSAGAAPIMTMVPALAGLGAAAAFFL
ncbi:uncharacterized protein SETTUDRAFT_90080 [Exserohilum turcica Et28A]|uniref:Uncharacterized protein n=1 Tax=Exserohilum turcicum (strain 28A) TaxID=671987 RepID=R0JW74_EXST2|nr:uncharacterized protein SETTUDRAFT_90080 [Exserohilum turcica Et28A]EOA85193.1 hypothetical protein SETTUDRAFT_90080 [Exserohilum turcica Et28A]